MGIRLFKQLGWGLTDVRHSKGGALNDPRISVGALDRRPDDIGPDYLKHLMRLRGLEEENSDAWLDLSLDIGMIESAAERGPVEYPVTRRSDRGSPGVLLVQPVGYDKWNRYADVIDQHEEEALHPDADYRIVPMPHGIFPFSGLYMDSRDGRRVDDTLKRLIDRLLERQKTEEDQECRKYREVADKFARQLGFDGAEQAQKLIVPEVPREVRLVCDWLGLFTSSDVALQLRPMLYVYWS